MHTVIDIQSIEEPNRTEIYIIPYEEMIMHTGIQKDHIHREKTIKNV